MSSLQKLPEWVRILGILAATFMAGGTAYAALSQQRDLPERVAQLEAQQEATSAALKYLACRALAEDEGRDPRLCRYVVNGVDELLDGLRRR